jgi:hypothetical protein
VQQYTSNLVQQYTSNLVQQYTSNLVQQYTSNQAFLTCGAFDLPAPRSGKQMGPGLPSSDMWSNAAFVISNIQRMRT